MKFRRPKSNLIASRISLVDVGSRGVLPPYWSPLAPILERIAFEADEGAEVHKDEDQSGDIRVALGAATSDSALLYLTKKPEMSSLYEPLGNTGGFSRKHYEGRQLSEARPVKIATLDTPGLVPHRPVSAVKVDTQGAEYAVITGGAGLLKSDLPLVFLETWTQQIYGRAPLFHEVHELMLSLGFELIDLETAASWNSTEHKYLWGRGRLVGVNLLYAPRASDIISIDDLEQRRKLLFLLSYWDFADYAAYLAESSRDWDFLQFLAEEGRRGARLHSRVGRRLRRLMGTSPMRRIT